MVKLFLIFIFPLICISSNAQSSSNGVDSLYQVMVLEFKTDNQHFDSILFNVLNSTYRIENSEISLIVVNRHLLPNGFCVTYLNNGIEIIPFYFSDYKTLVLGKLRKLNAAKYSCLSRDSLLIAFNDTCSYYFSGTEHDKYLSFLLLRSGMMAKEKNLMLSNLMECTEKHLRSIFRKLFCFLDSALPYKSGNCKVECN